MPDRPPQEPRPACGDRDRLSYSEAARLLQLAANTVAVRLPAAHKRLAHILDRLDLL